MALNRKQLNYLTKMLLHLKLHDMILCINISIICQYFLFTNIFLILMMNLINNYNKINL